MLTKAISPLLSSKGRSCCLWGNLNCSWYLHSSRYPSSLGGVWVLHLGSLCWLSVRLWMLWQKGAALSRSDFSLSAVLTSNSSTLAKACARGNPKFWRRLLELVPSPPPFQAEEQQRACGMGGWFQAGAMWLRGRWENRRATACRNWQQCSPSSLSFDTHTTWK